MSHPFTFGGGKFRSNSYFGPVKTVYLGSYKAALLPSKPYDETLHRMSEDSDLNYQLIKKGHEILLVNTIKVEYYCKENLRDFFKLCFNYGIGRGLFVIKNKVFNEFRQFICIFLAFSCFFLFVLSFYSILYFHILAIILLIYLLTCFLLSHNIKRNKYADIYTYFIGFIGCHFFWVIGFIYSFNLYFKLKKNHC